MPRAPHDQADGVERDALIDALVQTSFATMAVLNTIAADHDLSLTQLRVLAILRDRTVSMTRLARYLGLDKSTMTGLVDRAQKRHLLERAPNPNDGRVVDVFLTADGIELSDGIYVQVARTLTPTISTLAAPDRRRLQALLEQLLSSGGAGTMGS
jgi:DNA-binding MarR family transcriptional regulator